MGVPLDSILGPLLFSIFRNDLFIWLTKSDLHSFADNNTIAVTFKNLNDPFQSFEKELESTVDWIRNNKIIRNPGKFQTIIRNKRRENQITHNNEIYDNEIETAKSVKLGDTEINNQLSFN